MYEPFFTFPSVSQKQILTSNGYKFVEEKKIFEEALEPLFDPERWANDVIIEVFLKGLDATMNSNLNGAV